MGKRGPEPKLKCTKGHSLVGDDKVQVVLTAKGYYERRCLECKRERARKWWRENRSKAALAKKEK